jgi:hypothetical protein
MLTGAGVLVAAFGALAVMWVFVLLCSPAFGSPPEH